MTQGQARTKVRTIEALRGLAAFSVVLSHVTASLVQNPELGAGHLRGLVLPGGLGVEFFFTLSGFVMAMTHGGQIGRAGAIPGFLWTRFRRLYPLLWVVLALQCAVNPGVAALFTLRQWVNWITLNPAQVLDLISVLWTLKLEVSFYVLLALAMLPVVGRAVLLAWVVASPVAAAVGRGAADGAAVGGGLSAALSVPGVQPGFPAGFLHRPGRSARGAAGLGRGDFGRGGGGLDRRAAAVRRLG